MSSINIIAKTSLESLPNYIESDKMYNIYFITSINNNNKKKKSKRNTEHRSIYWGRVITSAFETKR